MLSEEWVRQRKTEERHNLKPSVRAGSPGTNSCQSGCAIAFISLCQAIGPAPSECGKCLTSAPCARLRSFPEERIGEEQINSGYSLLISASAHGFCG